MAIPAEQNPLTSSKRKRSQTGRTKPPRSKSRKRHKAARRSRVDEIAALGSVDLAGLAGQFDPGRYQPSYKITEFRTAERIGRTLYYKLKARGLGPRETNYGGALRITHSDRLAWQQMMQNPSPEQQEALDALNARRQLNARAAAAVAKQSPNHISNPQSPWRRKRAAQTAPPPFRFKEHTRKRRD